MDELELLKKDWKRRETESPRLSYDQINRMLFKRSTSIVKWIFIISILELLLWSIISLLTPKSTLDVIEKLGIETILLSFNVFHYGIFIAFIVLFYRNYTSIRVTDTTRDLMESILRTRRTVRYFVLYNILAFVVTIIFINYYYYTHSELLIEIMKDIYGAKIKDRDAFLNYFFLAQLVFGVVMVMFLLLFYRVVYGILLGRLKKNYRELDKAEELTI